jgi:hypothetical protein
MRTPLLVPVLVIMLMGHIALASHETDVRDGIVELVVNLIFQKLYSRNPMSNQQDCKQIFQ